MSKDDWEDNGLIRCPQCKSYDVAHVTIPWKGECYICSICKHEEVIGGENPPKRIRRGVAI